MKKLDDYFTVTKRKSSYSKEDTKKTKLEISRFFRKDKENHQQQTLLKLLNNNNKKKEVIDPKTQQTQNTKKKEDSESVIIENKIKKSKDKKNKNEQIIKIIKEKEQKKEENIETIEETKEENIENIEEKKEENIENIEEKKEIALIKLKEKNNESEFEEDEDSENSEEESYEKQRAAQMKENQKLIEKLGLHENPIIPIASKKTAIKRTKKPKRTSLNATKQYNLRGNKSEAFNNTDIRDILLEKDQIHLIQEEEETFIESGVLNYVSQKNETTKNGLTSLIHKDIEDISIYNHTNYSCFENRLEKTYSMSFSNNLLLAGGGGGIVAVFPLDNKSNNHNNNNNNNNNNQEEEIILSSLLCWKAHSGWISKVQFLSQQPDDTKKLILTAANDSFLKLWDVYQKTNIKQEPQLIHKNNTFHTSGIFSFDEMNGKILSAGKDSKICYSSIDLQSGFSKISEFLFHTASLKHIKFSRHDDYTFASCGNDSQICIGDVRSKKVSKSLQDMHDYSTINSVSWHPTDQNFILSSSSDLKINLYDLRNPSKVFHSFKGHHHLTCRKVNIYHPFFIEKGKKILTTGAKNNSLSLYDTFLGKTVSRGDIGMKPTTIMAYENLVACASSKRIVFLKAKSEKA